MQKQRYHSDRLRVKADSPTRAWRYAARHPGWTMRAAVRSITAHRC